MKLIDHCEPVFQFVCRLKRIAQREKTFQATLSIATVKKDVDRLFRKFEYGLVHDEDFEGDPEQFIELSRDFVHVMIAGAGLKISGPWEEECINQQGGTIEGIENRFFESLKDWLEDTSLEANDRLIFYHTCLGLGFASGSVHKEFVECVNQLDERIDRIMPHYKNDILCQQTYEHTNEDNYIIRPLPKLIAYAVTLAALFCVIFYIVLSSYTAASKDLVHAVDSVIAMEVDEVSE